MSHGKGISPSPSGDVIYEGPKPTTAQDLGGIHLSAGLIALIVLAAMCAVLGAIYAYIYFTKINPKSHRARKSAEHPPNDDENHQGTSTHLFLFKKS